MQNKIHYSETFIKKARFYKKKYASLIGDLKILEESLLDNPKQGNNLGGGLYKVRLAVQSKGKGKSGGFRVVTYLINEEDDSISITMITLYDKSEESTIDKKHLQKIIKELFNE